MSRFLITVPTDLLTEFKKLTVPGSRSKIIQRAITIYVKENKPSLKKKEKRDKWGDLLALRKGNYKKEDAVTLQHKIWKNVIRH